MTMSAPLTLVWFKRSFRINHNPLLWAAQQYPDPLLPVFIWDGDRHEDNPWPLGGASRWWLHHSLKAFSQQWAQQGRHFWIVQGPVRDQIQTLLSELPVTRLMTDQLFEPAADALDALIAQTCSQRGIAFERYNTQLMLDPTQVKNLQGKPYQVFTPFYKHHRPLLNPPQPQVLGSLPVTVPAQTWPSLSVDELGLLPRLDWDKGFYPMWTPGEAGAMTQLNKAIDQQAISQYAQYRDFPAIEGTSRLSPYLHFGEISPWQIWGTLRHQSSLGDSGSEPFVRQLFWREFAYHSLASTPHFDSQPQKKVFDTFPWQDNPSQLRAWQQGKTGYPIVDAGMRELWSTGWMHNRVRMIVGSFLVKDLLIPWQSGAAWFWDTLVDANLANNSLGWQWIAGCGPDAAPYFRIFNPLLQSEKFDPEGVYLRQWLPELRALPTPWIHKPFEAPTLVLQQAGITLGKDYPKPLVNHSIARQEALSAYKSLKPQVLT